MQAFSWNPFLDPKEVSLSFVPVNALLGRRVARSGDLIGPPPDTRFRPLLERRWGEALQVQEVLAA